MFNHLQSDQIDQLAKSLSKAQGELESALKDSTNPFFKNKYADLASVWSAAKFPLSSNGLSVVQQFIYDGDKIILVSTLAHSSGQWMRSFLPIVPTENVIKNKQGEIMGYKKIDVQNVGAGITYMRRYALAALIGITQDDDDGESAVGRGRSKKHNYSTSEDINYVPDQTKKPTQQDEINKTISPQHADELMSLFDKCSPSFKEKTNDYLINVLKINSLQQLSENSYESYKNRMLTEIDEYNTKLINLSQDFSYENINNA